MASKRVGKSDFENNFVKKWPGWDTLPINDESVENGGGIEKIIAWKHAVENTLQGMPP